jgi:hypothetical protein
MVQEALRRQDPTSYVGICPHLDLGSIPTVKNLDLLCIGYCNVNGFPATIIGNATVNTIRQYSRKHDLDGFVGVEANINWKMMPEESAT